MSQAMHVFVSKKVPIEDMSDDDIAEAMRLFEESELDPLKGYELMEMQLLEKGFEEVQKYFRFKNKDGDQQILGI